MPRKKVCNWLSTAVRPLTSSSTVCASLGAPLVFRTKLLNTGATLAAAHRMPTIDAVTEIGSMNAKEKWDQGLKIEEDWETISSVNQLPYLTG